MCYIPDPIELGEMRAERWEEQLYIGNGKYRCVNCTVPHELKDMTQASADPYGPPMCWDCLKKVAPELYRFIEEQSSKPSVEDCDL